MSNYRRRVGFPIDTGTYRRTELRSRRTEPLATCRPSNGRRLRLRSHDRPWLKLYFSPGQSLWARHSVAGRWCGRVDSGARRWSPATAQPDARRACGDFLAGYCRWGSSGILDPQTLKPSCRSTLACLQIWASKWVTRTHIALKGTLTSCSVAHFGGFSALHSFDLVLIWFAACHLRAVQFQAHLSCCGKSSHVVHCASRTHPLPGSNWILWNLFWIRNPSGRRLWGQYLSLELQSTSASSQLSPHRRLFGAFGDLSVSP